MYKFLFAAGRARTIPSWSHVNGEPAWAQSKAKTRKYPLGQTIWAYMLGSTAHAPASPAVTSQPSMTHRLKDLLCGSQSEAERMDAAYQLGRAGCAGSAESVDELVDALQRSNDAVQRAAMHGLAAAGPVATDSLMAVLTRTDADHHVASCSAVHALGEAAEAPSLAMVNAITALMDRVAKTIAMEAYAAGGWPVGGGGHPPSSGFHTSPNPKERQAWTPKLLHATCLQALGLLGQQAVAAGDIHIVHAIVEQCLTCMNAAEPGGENPDYPPDSFLGNGFMSRQNAALALRTLCNEGTLAMNAELRQAVEVACSKTTADRDLFLAHYCRDTLRHIGPGNY